MAQRTPLKRSMMAKTSRQLSPDPTLRESWVRDARVKVRRFPNRRSFAPSSRSLLVVQLEVAATLCIGLAVEEPHGFPFPDQGRDARTNPVALPTETPFAV